MFIKVEKEQISSTIVNSNIFTTITEIIPEEKRIEELQSKLESENYLPRLYPGSYEDEEVEEIYDLVTEKLLVRTELEATRDTILTLDPEVLKIMHRHNSTYQQVRIMKQDTEKLEEIKLRFEEDLIKRKLEVFGGRKGENVSD